MTATECMNAIYLKAVGKVASFAITDTKGIKILGLMNFYTQRWASETGIDWMSLYEPNLQVATITATDTFSLDLSTIRKLSQQEGDNVRIIWSGDTGTITNPVKFTDYELVPGDRLKDFNSGPFCARRNDQLVFNRKFLSTDAQFGGKLYVPCYLYPDTLVNGTDDIQVDDPNWLVLICAAEYVRTDLTRLGQYPNLLTEANDCMTRMKDDNANDQNTDATQEWNPSPWSASGNNWWA